MISTQEWGSKSKEEILEQLSKVGIKPKKWYQRV